MEPGKSRIICRILWFEDDTGTEAQRLNGESVTELSSKEKLRKSYQNCGAGEYGNAKLKYFLLFSTTLDSWQPL